MDSGKGMLSGAFWQWRERVAGLRGGGVEIEAVEAVSPRQ
jgi:hypothetical protein